VNEWTLLEACRTRAGITESLPGRCLITPVAGHTQDPGLRTGPGHSTADCGARPPVSTACRSMIAAPGGLVWAAPSNATGASRTELDRQVAV
jgi:hypothetical protein